MSLYSSVLQGGRLSVKRFWVQSHPASLLLGLILGSVATVLVLNFSIGFHSGPYMHTNGARGTELSTPPNKDKTEQLWRECKDLIVVAGHSVFTGANFEDADDFKSPWILMSYQEKQLPAFLNHIRAGVEIAANNEKALLVFSGGETRLEGGPRSEAQSYWWVADAHGWFGKPSSVRDRAVTEEHARDSFENLLFSICRFKEVVGSYPETITVISFTFKKQRFETLHREAIRWPSDKFHYVGVDVDQNHPMPQDVYDGEKKNSLIPFKKDPYGCQGVLALKKSTRNPFKKQISYPKGCPDIAGLFNHCDETLYEGPLPWTSNHKEL
mmetsp:Transcript_1408/g.2106  ORF Transcript_1408/g.2106 Transcript_1408/m.2106 type:complete len:326 (-) Transcript_1408:378-1355(-)